MKMNAIVIGKMEFAPGQFILRVAPANWELPGFIPGQYCVLGLPGSAPRSDYADAEEPLDDPDKLIRRAYSIASSSLEKEYLEFFISVVRSGMLTPRLYHLKIGDEIFLGTKIVGVLTISEIPEDTDIILMGTGTGIAPYISMLRSLIDASSIDKRILVVHGARHSWDLGYNSEFQTMNKLSENFFYLPVISRPDEEFIPWKGEVGYIQDMWTKGIIEKVLNLQPTPENSHILLCGNPGMIEDTLKILLEDNFTEHTRKSPGQVHIERYW